MADPTINDSTSKSLGDLMTSYNELNNATIDELHHEPSPLEFMRYVARNTPFVVRGGANWEAQQKWSPEYLRHELRGQKVNVAVTPSGNADAPTFSNAHRETVIAKPHEEDQLFEEFLDYVIGQETDPAFPASAEVRYAQTQNDNFRNEYVSLYHDAQKDIPFARIALQRPPDAINLWVGNSRSVTCLHRDPMENIYIQVLGRKHFVLLSPLFHASVCERMLPQATYKREGDALKLELDEDGERVPLATWDPEDPETSPSQFSAFAKPVQVTLDPGDMLYLPAMWYHKVKQSCNAEGCVVAINYWYDMDFSGPFYPMTNLVRNLGPD